MWPLKGIRGRRAALAWLLIITTSPDREPSGMSLRGGRKLLIEWAGGHFFNSAGNRLATDHRKRPVLAGPQMGHSFPAFSYHPNPNDWESDGFPNFSAPARGPHAACC